MADETDAGMETPATSLAPESVGRIGGVFGSSLSCPTFSFGGVGPLSFRVKGALVDHASPGCSVRCCVFPGGKRHNDRETLILAVIKNLTFRETFARLFLNYRSKSERNIE